jgi:thiol-disulfide isomerase/thioredoxin
VNLPAVRARAFSERRRRGGRQKETERLVVIQCTFSWCRPCKGFKPKYVRLAVEYPQVAFLSLVANENEETKEVYERLQTFTSGAMFGTPAHVLIRHGKLVRNTGVVARQKVAKEAPCVPRPYNNTDFLSGYSTTTRADA